MTEHAVILPDEPLVQGHLGPRELDARLLRPITAPERWLGPALGVSGLGTLVFVVAVVDTVITGVGLWGNQIPVAWGLGIVNMVWWIGIGHAGTFISAFLLLLDQEWRGSINRIAETMTLYAVLLAGLFPILHMGRPWFIYWLWPYPATMGVWPQFRSSLTFDAVAIPTYFLVSLLFWYLGLVPDLATARDVAPTLRRRRLYGVFALGWRGSSRHWQHLRVAQGLLAGLATPLVVSVHSIISFDFAIAQLPGWHSTLMPPMFVLGALHSGVAMVILLVVVLRAAWHLHAAITPRHLEALARLLLLLGSLLGWCYAVEMFDAWYSGVPYDRDTMLRLRPHGPYGGLFWAMITLNVLLPQLCWWRAVRRSGPALAVIGIGVLAGMWIERFVIVVGSLTNDFLPSSWRSFQPTWVDAAIFWGSVSAFFFLFLLTVRVVPPIPVHEVRRLAHEQAPR